MANTNERPPDPSTEARLAPPDAVRVGTTAGTPGAAAGQVAPGEPHPAPRTGPPPGPAPQGPESRPPSHPLRKWLILAAVGVGLAVGAYFLVPWVITALNTVSTDDAYVNGHVTYVAPRVPGQVVKVLVDDNYRVKKRLCRASRAIPAESATVLTAPRPAPPPRGGPSG